MIINGHKIKWKREVDVNKINRYGESYIVAEKEKDNSRSNKTFFFFLSNDKSYNYIRRLILDDDKYKIISQGKLDNISTLGIISTYIRTKNYEVFVEDERKR